ncbi:MAG: hypothetical protein M3O26_13430 [Pseudomonadota bacterium]|nr:hypothetical protein [Pseudomonadota bacterium]
MLKSARGRGYGEMRAPVCQHAQKRLVAAGEVVPVWASARAPDGGLDGPGLDGPGLHR